MESLLFPKIIYGTAWKKERTKQLVIDAILAGFTAIDTACQPKHYQEKLVGDALAVLAEKYKINRSQLFLQTKFTPLSGQDLTNVPYNKNANLETQVKESLAKSLENLGTNYLDSLLLHSPLKNLEETLKVWKEFETFVNEGKVKKIGISNIYSLEYLEKIWNEVSLKPSIIQNRFYSETNYDSEIRKFCAKNSIVYQSFWTLTGNPHIISNPKFLKIAEVLNITKEQLFFRYVMQLGIVPLTGTSNKAHMKQDLAVLDLSELNANDINNINKLVFENLKH